MNLQTVAYNSLTDIPLKDAIAVAMDTFPTADFSGIKTPIDLESMLNGMNQTLYVQVDTDAPVTAALAAEATLKQETAQQVSELQCDLPPQTFSNDDLSADLCAETPEFPTPIIVPDSDVTDLLNTLNDAVTANSGDIQKVTDCVSKMTSITNDLITLTKKEQDIKDTLINLEEFLYNYRLMEAYFKKRVETLDNLLGTFDPLLTQKNDFTSQISLLSPLVTQALTDYNAANARLLSGQAPAETQEHVNQLQSTYSSLNSQLTDLQTKLTDVNNTIKFKESNISPFLKEQDFENTSSFQGLTPTGKDEARLNWLHDNIQNLFNGGSNAFTKVASFTSRTILKPNPSASAQNESFLLTIQHTMLDALNLLAGRPKTYATTTGSTTIQPTPQNITPHGTLYDSLYNIWGDPERFFTREERGLTTDSNLASPQLKGTGAEFKSNFIQDTGKFSDFYQNFNSRHQDKTTLIKNTVIEPSLANSVSDLENLALKEVEYLLAFGKAFENLPADSSKLVDIITQVRQSSNQYIANVLELRTDYAFVQQSYKDLLDSIEAKKQEYMTVSCATTTPNPPEKQPNPPGSDPLGATTMQQISPEDPDPTKFCYWEKFALYATAVNILPVPGNGGFKYWPVGMKIPTPGGIVNIPLPIIWIPVAVIVLTAGIFVIFIGQCGICPSPFVFYIGPNGEKKFIVSLRPTDEFGAKASESIIKTIDKGGIAIKKKTNDLINKINIPGFTPIQSPDSSKTVLDDVKDKILKKVQKLGVPDITPITSKITTHSTIAEKKAALKEVVNNYFNKLTIPDIKIPKNSTNVNPKPLPMIEAVNQMLKLFKMDLPQIAIPSGDKISLKTKLISQLGSLKPSEIGNVNVAPIDFNASTPAQQSAYMKSVKEAMKNGISIGHSKITPKELGVVTSVLGSGIVFLNPYKCRPGAAGLGIPPLSPVAVAGLGAIKIASDLFIDGLTLDQIKNFTLSTGGAITASFLPALLTKTLAAIPDISIPNPSKVSIKDMLKDSSLKLVKMQLPSFPDPSVPPQIQIPIPGEALKGAITSAVNQTINNVPITDINFATLSPIDMKQIIIGFVESSFTPIQSFLDPFLKIISKYQAAKDKTFPEILGLKKVSTDDSMIATVTKEAVDGALAALKLVALIPYPAVAFMPQVFSQAHPILSSDDLPPWKRFTLDNFLYVVFLDAFCTQGKKGGGLQENP